MGHWRRGAVVAGVCTLLQTRIAVGRVERQLLAAELRGVEGACAVRAIMEMILSAAGEAVG